MKIQCDVCNKNEASIYCSADEAALCSACDHRVHHANKLAGKHPRFSLLHPSPKNSPVCDICQDKKAFLFCQQDRAILCKDCDLAIHKTNQHTLTHNRFLLTGVKLSPTASLYSCCSNPPATLPLTNSGVVVVVPDRQRKPAPIMNQGSVVVTTNCQQESTTSSISEYLIDMLPGWHVEEFLDPPSNFYKVVIDSIEEKKLQVGDNDPGLIWGSNLKDGSLNSSFSPESMGIWVPQAPPPARTAHVFQQFEPRSNMGFGDQAINGSSIVFGQNDYSNNVNKITNGAKLSRNWVSDNGNCFTVPQISPSSTASKRSRTLWQ